MLYRGTLVFVTKADATQSLTHASHTRQVPRWKKYRRPYHAPVHPCGTPSAIHMCSAPLPLGSGLPVTPACGPFTGAGTATWNVTRCGNTTGRITGTTPTVGGMSPRTGAAIVLGSETVSPASAMTAARGSSHSVAAAGASLAASPAGGLASVAAGVLSPLLPCALRGGNRTSDIPESYNETR